MNLFVAKLSSSTTGDELERIFSEYGEVTSAKIIFDKVTKNSKGYGFVEMPDNEEAEKAIAALNGSELDGKEIVVKEANAREERPRRDSRGGGGFQNRGGGGGGFQRRDNRRDDRRGGPGGGQRRFDNRGRSGGGGGYDQNERW